MEKKKALVLFPCAASHRAALINAAGDLCDFVFREPDWTEEQYHAALKTANLIIGEPRNEDFQYCEKLELMHSPSSGVNYYVAGGKFPQNATLCCMTGGYGNVLAEHLLALVLSLCRRLPEYHDQQKAHKWELRKYDKQLEDCTLLILGAGDIGTTLATWMRPMVKRIIGVRRVAREYPACYDEMITLDALDERLGEADIIVCALPHTPETVHLLNEDRLRRMKPDAVLVNGGRGSLIDQEALCRLLAEGRFWGVGLEVAYPEPLPADHPLWEQPRVIITPHAAGNSFAPDSPLVRKIWNFIIPNVKRWLRGGEPENKVDFSTGYRETQRGGMENPVLNEINGAYSQLEAKHDELMKTLKQEIPDAASGWYNGHYHKKGNGQWVKEAFPIPVISLKGLCDIEIRFDGISVTAKLGREAALARTYEDLMAYEFEAYGVENYLSDYYGPGQTERELKENIGRGNERNIGFSFAFPFGADGKQLLEFVKLLKREGFFY